MPFKLFYENMNYKQTVIIATLQALNPVLSLPPSGSLQRVFDFCTKVSEYLIK